ncbi:MAG: hypothetical protein A3E31_03420 [Candidatus Rokubacteria bacterium RIFCSPHIGHO2_12_FULL_73_22]|nr:MAG: hypothetical protein A3D33_13040 [Candidatus Rokubacteria bacterium RIFCSPHIGHO2_02_FULL_73_26]OGK98745.1 MAG: hypothetical protein A3E31_03420 [Candidatus Rokubacteria bacterium RIFCSPHIGHO2_12_FULL_73_22]OGL10504.1 MAG: hypothetical protein A3I14_12085 [Candidatus Rokubacteria bacterium RIFCSPLOWO2_02_FULL_73_56]
MTPGGDDLRPELRRRAGELLARLAPSAREALLVRGWMSHDARWFNAVARAYGLEAANRLNRIAARAVGEAEAPRVLRALARPPVAGLDDCLLAQEALIGLLGPELLDYRVRQLDARTYRIEVERCFAYDNVVRAGVADSYECGIFERVAGWLDALGLAYRMNPCLGKCLKAQGRDCAYEIALGASAPGAASPVQPNRGPARR